MRYGSDQFYMRPPEEMYQPFPRPGGGGQAEPGNRRQCDIKLDFKKRHFPVFTPPEEKTPEQYLRELCEIGLKSVTAPASPDAGPLAAAKERLEHELGIIFRMGFAGYFLIVWDFVRFAISQNIPASPRFRPGFGQGTALASALLTAAAPTRLAVYDKRARSGLQKVELELPDRGPRFYARYMTLIEQCRTEGTDEGNRWSARDVDLALWILGK